MAAKAAAQRETSVESGELESAIVRQLTAFLDQRFAEFERKHFGDKTQPAEDRQCGISGVSLGPSPEHEKQLYAFMTEQNQSLGRRIYDLEARIQVLETDRDLIVEREIERRMRKPGSDQCGTQGEIRKERGFASVYEPGFKAGRDRY